MKQIATLQVALGERSYAIHMGSGLLRDAALWKGLVTGSTAMVVSDQVVAPLYYPALSETLAGNGVEVGQHILQTGEQQKTVESWNAITNRLAEERHDRTSTVIALGGGVVGDLAGFAAATWMRGVPYVQVPTSLLAQVDSSVGGKTGINHARGKNLIGAFYQPSGVVADLDALETLPRRELVAGLAEVIKYGVIRDAEFFSWLEESLDALLARDTEALVRAVSRSCEIKARVVAADERESGQREILNFGHTFAHALETLTGYEELNHGEAVAIGMVMASRLSCAEGWLDGESALRIERLVGRLGVMHRLPKGLRVDALLEAFQSDKKTRAGRPRFVLTRGVGHAETCETVSLDRLSAVLQAFIP